MMKKHWELAFKSAWDLRKLILNKEISPVELVEDALSRLNDINPKLNAFITYRSFLSKLLFILSIFLQSRGNH